MFVVWRTGRRGLAAVAGLATCGVVGAAALMIFVIMAVVSWPAGTAKADVLVSNIGQDEDSGEAFIDYELAQSFTTGTHAAGYTLTSIGSIPTKVREATFLRADP